VAGCIQVRLLRRAKPSLDSPANPPAGVATASPKLGRYESASGKLSSSWMENITSNLAQRRSFRAMIPLGIRCRVSQSQHQRRAR